MWDATGLTDGSTFGQFVGGYGGGAPAGGAGGELDRGDAARLRPAVDRDDAVARVDRDDDPAGVGAAGGLDERGGADRGGAEDGERGAEREGAVDGVAVAQAAADLDGDRRGRDELGEQGELARLAERAVEIDDVEAVGAIPRELGDELDRAVVEHGGAVALALLEPDGAAAEQIDRREELHARSTKLRKIRSPTAWLFSGWNWHAKTLSFRTAAVSRTPCSASSVTSAGSSGTAW